MGGLAGFSLALQHDSLIFNLLSGFGGARRGQARQAHRSVPVQVLISPNHEGGGAKQAVNFRVMMHMFHEVGLNRLTDR